MAAGSIELMSVEELPCGVVQTFKPTDSQLVGHYLYGKITMMVHGGNCRGKQTFRELEIYGNTGMTPWDIWKSFEAEKLPHQDFFFFFSKVKRLSKNGKGKRSRRTVGCRGTWSETEPAKPVYVDGIQEPFGKMRKFRYENKDKSFEHHTAWMMEEYSVDHSCVNSSDLVLCRMKRNESNNKRKRNFTEDEEENPSRTKSFKSREQLTAHSHQQQQEQEQEQQLSDFVPQEWIDVDDLLFGDNIDEQGVEEQGCIALVDQQIEGQEFNNNYYISIVDDAVTVSQNESEEAGLEDNSWLDAYLNSEESENYNVGELGWVDIGTAVTLPQSPSFAQLLGD